MFPGALVGTGSQDAGDVGEHDQGVPIEPPSPLFAKLDPSVVDEELARLEQGQEA